MKASEARKIADAALHESILQEIEVQAKRGGHWIVVQQIGNGATKTLEALGYSVTQGEYNPSMGIKGTKISWEEAQ
jgi:hypothetical protein